jgi:hypothetical protein
MHKHLKKVVESTESHENMGLLWTYFELKDIYAFL